MKLARPSALAIVATCFLGSGLVRVWDSSAAFAEGAAELMTSAASADGTEMASLDQCPPQLEPESLLLAIQEREQQLAEREARLADREQILRVSKIKIEEQMAALQAVEASLSSTLSGADKAAEKDIDRITTVYESMKPANAAELFETMDVTFAAGFLMRMRPDAAAAIMSNLTADAAYAISVVMAGRNADVPKE